MTEVSLDDVTRQWTLYGMDRQGLDDMIELVSMAAHDGSSAETTMGGDDSGGGKGENVDWNKLLALAAGQLGNV